MQRHKLKGSCITSVDDHNYNFTWIQSFEAPYNLREMSPLDPFDPDVYIDGVPLTNTIKWENDITFAGANAARNHYLYAVCLRKLRITPAEIIVA